MNIATVLIVLLILLLVGVVPLHGYSANWGYGPSSVLGVVLLIVLVLFLV